MSAKYSLIEETYVWDCIFGCHGTDHESIWEAEQAELGHNCRCDAA